MSSADAHGDRAWVPAPGTVIAGRYRVTALIGAGGMGAVVAAEHMALGDMVAVKLLHPRMSADLDHIARFLREARVTAKIKDEHVVRVFDVGTTEQGLPFLAMELLAGEDLGHVSTRQRVPLALAVDYVLQAMVGLMHAHSVGVVHRDVKPSNLWLTHRPDGAPLVKVLDFGISKLAEAQEGEKRLTETSSSFGSPSYMAPEQVRSAKRADARSDAWSIGVVLFELLTQRLPFDADNVSGVLAAIVADEPTPLQKLLPDAPPAVANVISRLLSKSPDARPTLREVAFELRPYASPAGQATADAIARTFGVGVSAHVVAPQSMPNVASFDHSAALGETQRPVSTTSRAVRSSRRLGLIAGVVAVVGVVALSFVITRAYRHRSLPATPVPETSVASEPVKRDSVPSAAAVVTAVPVQPTSSPAESVALPTLPTPPTPSARPTHTRPQAPSGAGIGASPRPTAPAAVSVAPVVAPAPSPPPAAAATSDTRQ